jgi:ribosome-interacting GTPase 1
VESIVINCPRNDVLYPAQKNKATSYHLGQLKAKLAKLRRELISTPSGDYHIAKKWRMAPN